MEGAIFTSWYGQASCTAGRASFMTGRIPIRSALSVVVGPGRRELPPQGDAHHRLVLQKERLLDLLLRQVASRR
jgi:arylsulfatase A-like enzyme